MTYNKEQQRIKREGYREGQEDTRREENAALSGLSLGIVLVLIAGAIAGTLFYFYRRTEPVPTLSPSATPNAISPAPEKETIIREEKVRELVPVPQSEAPQPNVNIVVPSNPDAPTAAPSPMAPNPSAPEATAPETPKEAPASPAPNPN